MLLLYHLILFLSWTTELRITFLLLVLNFWVTKLSCCCKMFWLRGWHQLCQMMKSNTSNGLRLISFAFNSILRKDFLKYVQVFRRLYERTMFNFSQWSKCFHLLNCACLYYFVINFQPLYISLYLSQKVYFCTWLTKYLILCQTLQQE
jgi:hypothetical protein